jgi:putative endonuclease
MSVTTKGAGSAGEALALRFLQRQGMKVVTLNYRVARGPGRPGGEIDLILRDRDGTLVFVEVRQRRGTDHGGAAASVSAAKRLRIVRTAQHYLARISPLPPCRFDVVAIDGERIEWLKAAFDTG